MTDGSVENRCENSVRHMVKGTVIMALKSTEKSRQLVRTSVHLFFLLAAKVLAGKGRGCLNENIGKAKYSTL